MKFLSCRTVAARMCPLAAALIALVGVVSVPSPAASAAGRAETAGNAGVTGRPAPVSPYLSLGWGDPPDPVEVMRATGVRWFTLAFVLSKGECSPRWDGRRPLTGGSDERAVRAVRAAGGDVIASFGGGLGHKLEESCPDARSLADAYQKVIDAYTLRAIDVDIETDAYRDPRVRERTVRALLRVVARNPGLSVHVTLPSTPSGPSPVLIDAAAAAGLEPDVWTIMPFAFGRDGRDRDMGRLSTRAMDGLADRLRDAYGYTAAEAYAHGGVSSMNGVTGHDELITLQDFRAVRTHAERHGLARLAFWSVNRDRPCPTATYPADDTCSGVDQGKWDYTRVLAGYGDR